MSLLKVLARIAVLVRHPPSIPPYVLGLLAAGCAVLFTFFLVPSAQFKNVEPLFAKNEHTPVQKPDASADLKSDLNVEIMAIPVQVVDLESPKASGSGEDDRRARLQQARVGMNILIRSGYIRDASVRTDSSTSPPDIQYIAIPEDDVRECVRLDRYEGEDESPSNEASVGAAATDAPNAGAQDLATAQAATEDRLRMAEQLAIAAVAIEKFHRTTLHRRVEWLYARGYRAVFGSLPDLSFGPAQIRSSRVRQLARNFPSPDPRYRELADILGQSEADLAATLADECRSMRLTAAIMYSYLKQASDCDERNMSTCPEDPATFAARMYNGQRRATSAVIDYAPVLASMLEMISRGTEPADSAQPKSTLQPPLDSSSSPVTDKPENHSPLPPGTAESKPVPQTTVRASARNSPRDPSKNTRAKSSKRSP